MNRVRQSYDAAAGFTLLELLVVLAVVGAMVGTLLFFAVPSSLQKDRAPAEQAFELMQQMRMQSILQRRILGLDKPDEENILQVLLLDEGVRVATPAPPLPTNGEVFASSASSNPEAEQEPEEPAYPDYAERKETADQLGLVSSSGEATWEIAEDYDVIDFSDTGLLFFFFLQQEDTGLAYLSEDPTFTLLEDEDEDEAPELQPELVFFPDGRLSIPGSVRLVTADEEVIYAFSWDVFGRFELDKQ